MNEIYWITRLDTIVIVSFVVTAIAALIVMGVVLAAFIDGDCEWIISKETRKKSLRSGLIVLAISSLVWMFVPDSKTALMIFGIGGTVDYIKENDTIKELPDKCVKALDAWVESLSEEEK